MPYSNHFVENLSGRMLISLAVCITSLVVILMSFLKYTSSLPAVHSPCDSSINLVESSVNKKLQHLCEESQEPLLGYAFFKQSVKAGMSVEDFYVVISDYNKKYYPTRYHSVVNAPPYTGQKVIWCMVWGEDGGMAVIVLASNNVGSVWFSRVDIDYPGTAMLPLTLLSGDNTDLLKALDAIPLCQPDSKLAEQMKSHGITRPVMQWAD